MSIRVLHISDGHGYLPKADAALAVDLVCFTGDDSAEYRCNLAKQTIFAREALAPSLLSWGVPVIGTPGNHNHIAATDEGLALLREIFAATGGAYLVDEGMEILGLSVHASPWTRPTMHSVFCGEEIELAQHWAKIPEGLSMLLTHSPPAGYLDNGWGSTTLREQVTWAKPLAHLFGHAHGASGVDCSYSTVFSNGSLVGEKLVPQGEATLLTFNDDGGVEFERVQLELVDHVHVAADN